MRTRRRPPAASKDKLHKFHIMKVTATPAKPVGVVRATNKHAALAQAIESYQISPHFQKRLIVLRRLQNFTQMQPALQDGDEPAMVLGW